MDSRPALHTASTLTPTACQYLTIMLPESTSLWLAKSKSTTARCSSTPGSSDSTNGSVVPPIRGPFVTLNLPSNTAA